jgi:hypothetical protein
MTSFSLHTLKQTLRKSGFEIVLQKKHGTPRSAIFPLYLTVLARPTADINPNSPKPETQVKMKRQLGMVTRRIIQRLFPKFAWVPIKIEQ